MHVDRGHQYTSAGIRTLCHKPLSSIRRDPRTSQHSHVHASRPVTPPREVPTPAVVDVVLDRMLLPCTCLHRERVQKYVSTRDVSRGRHGGQGASPADACVDLEQHCTPPCGAGRAQYGPHHCPLTPPPTPRLIRGSGVGALGSVPRPSAPLVTRPVTTVEPPHRHSGSSPSLAPPATPTTAHCPPPELGPPCWGPDGAGDWHAEGD